MDARSTLDAFVLVDHSNTGTIIGHRNRIHRAALHARSYQICDRIIRTGFCTLSTLFTFRWINIGLISSHADRSKPTSRLTGFSHTLLTVICYYISGNRTSFTGRINDLYDISVIFSTRCFTFRKPDPLSDNLSFPVDTASKCRLRSRNHLIRKTVSFFLQSSGIRKLGNFIQYFMFYF